MVNIKSKLIIKKKKMTPKFTVNLRTTDFQNNKKKAAYTQKHFTTRLEYIYETNRSTKTTTRIGHT